MHEVAAVGALIDAVVVAISEHRLCRVDVLRVQRGSTFSEEALVQAFTMLSRGTPLEGAHLDIETVNHIIDCPCGLRRAIQADELVGHIWVCSNCGHVEEIDEQDDLALLDVTLTPLETSAGIGGS